MGVSFFMQPRQERSRLHYAMLTAIVIVAGCASRSPLAEHWPPFLAVYAGDTLWSLMIYLGLGFLFPTLRTAVSAAIVLVFATGVEFSQLSDARWLESFRNTGIGAIVIGSSFLWSDFACYATGCGIGVTGELIGRATRTEPA
jgi:hypothetical protein